jgi:hypothetical protein
MQSGIPGAITRCMNALQIPAYTMAELARLKAVPDRGCWLLSSDHAEVIGRFGSDGNFVTATPRLTLVRGEDTLRLMEEPTLPLQEVVSTPTEPNLFLSLCTFLVPSFLSSVRRCLYTSLTIGVVSCLTALIVKERSLRSLAASAVVLCQKHAVRLLPLSFLLGAVFF